MTPRTSISQHIPSFETLHLPDDVLQVIDVDVPEEGFFEALCSEERQTLIDAVKTLVAPIVNGDVSADDLIAAASIEGKGSLELWEETLFLLTAWLSGALVTAQVVRASSYSGIARMLRGPHGQPPHVQTAQHIYLQFGVSLVLVDMIRMLQSVPNTPRSLEQSTIHTLLEGLAELWKGRANPLLVRTTDYVVGQVLHLLPHIFDFDPGGDESLSGPFSAINLPDFIRIARRDARVISKYGVGSIARVFEQQLALIVQSLGAIVVQTRPGERTVDLYCLSSLAATPFAFLVEAKTSKRSYGLPARDERALIEYIEQTSRLRTLPTLKFVLLVADKPAESLPRRMRRVEAECGIPVRFLSARGLAHLRDALVGPSALEEFGHLVIDSPSLLPDEIGDQVVSTIQRQQKAHEDLVRAMLGLPS